jgi:protein-tyrosine phosphatase
VIDLHTHILPGVDDGVDTEDAAVEFARVAVEDGIRVCVATPHCKEGFYDNDRPKVLEAVKRLKTRLDREKIDLELLPGAEVHVCPDLVQRVADGRALTLADNGKTLLLELSLSQYPVELNNLVFELNLAGIQVLFAHPERIKFFQDNPAQYEEVIRLGAWGQITTGSVLGVFGRTATTFSEELLRKGLVHVVATDAHNTRGRPPRMREAVDAISGIIGETRAEAMATSIPQALLEGRSPVVPPVELPKRSSFLGRFFERK